jgi:GNAT superfamily N-acetyltransferase
VLSPADPALDHAHRILRREFRPEEVLPRRHWEEVLRERAAELWTDTAWHLLVAEEGGRVVGAASGNYLGSRNVALVGYVVVDPAARSAGLGSRLRRALRLRFERDARRMRGRPLDALVGEVRADNPWLRHLVATDRVIALDFPYLQPSLRGPGRGVPLVLYYHPLTRRRRSLTTAEVRRLLYALWRRLYRIAQPLSRPVFRRMLASLEGRSHVGSLDLDALEGPARRRSRRSAGTHDEKCDVVGRLDAARKVLGIGDETGEDLRRRGPARPPA